MFQWWNSNGGDKYSKKLNMFAVMSSYDSYIFYLFSSLFGTLTNQIDRSQINFIVNRIFPYTVTTGIEKITQFVLPRHMVESVLFKRGDNDKWFNAWLDKTKYDPDSLLIYDFTTDPPTKIPDPNTKLIGVYPSIQDRQAWKQLIKEWGAKTWIQSGDKSSFEVPSLPSDEVKNWLNYDIRPDNFLARYGILPDCPLVVTYINNYNQDPLTGLKLDPQAFANLIGGENVGGWIGYLNGSKSGDMSSDDYFNYLNTHYATQIIIPPGKAKACSGGETATNWINGIVSGVGAGALPLFFLKSSMIGLPFWGLIGSAVLLAVGATYTSVSTANSKCKGT